MKQGTESKLKFKKLQRRLGLNRWQCTGLLESLWHVTIENAWLGDIGKLSNEDIAAAIEWEEDAGELIKALVETRWLDKSDKCRLFVHNWSIHCPAFLRGNAAKHGHVLADIANASRNEPRNERQSEPPNEPRNDVPAEQNVLPPSQAKPIQAKPSQGKPPKPPLDFQIDFPSGFDTAEVRLAWNDWLKHKPTKYKSHETAGKALKTYCTQFQTPDRLILGIELAIAGTWKGLSIEATLKSEKATKNGKSRTGPGQQHDPEHGQWAT